MPRRTRAGTRPAPQESPGRPATGVSAGRAPDPRPPSPEDRVERLRALCLSLPEVAERVSHGEPTWFAGAGRRARVFVMLADHHHDDRLAFWCPAPAGAQEFLIAEDPDRFFRPPYVGHRGWIGVDLDVPPVDWARIEDLVADAHALVVG
ncbi:MmcQ/YjbR family DNA-binding protein [Kitasatospora sp. NPDC050467]|uniref:MmcQ/YjbR family DNA-binding protein n=1 Tax=Kitasatospora sp. NPDC050467 TaxID=3364053 RepID=UPI00378E521E